MSRGINGKVKAIYLGYKLWQVPKIWYCFFVCCICIALLICSNFTRLFYALYRFRFLAALVFSVVGPRVTTSSDRFWRGVAIVVFAFNLVKTLLKTAGFELFN